MSDTTLNAFVASGTAAEMAAFTPTPPTPASGPDPGYFWYQTDTGNVYSWDGANWAAIAGSGTVTNTGTLTANKAIIGNGTVDVTVSAASGVAHLSSGTLTGSNVDLASEVTGDLPFANLAQLAALSVAANATNGTADIAGTALTDGQALKRVGTALVSAGFGPVSISLLTSGTGATYTVPAAVYRLRVRVQGPGGGGGGADGGSSQAGVGGGGSPGGYAEKVYSTTPGATFTYTIGTGGNGGAAGNNAGDPGSAATTFDNAGTPVSGDAGQGGASMAAGTSFSNSAGGASAAASGGDVNIAGGVGGRGQRYSGTAAFGGVGTNSLLGFGGQAGFGSDGQAAVGYGAGGGGGLSITVTDRAGGNGANGVIIVEEYN